MTFTDRQKYLLFFTVINYADPGLLLSYFLLQNLKTEYMNIFIALVGMCGSGKSVVADALVRKGYQFFRFGQITLDIIIEKGWEVNEQNERLIRESLRKEHGMGAYALKNLPKIDKLLREGNVVGDGLYSWDEYKILKEKYGDQLVVVAVYAPPKLRYERLSQRKQSEEDKAIRNRQLNADQARSRDFSEIENLDKGGPIAMADYTLINTGSVSLLLKQLVNVLTQL
jgi:dephospho-CoA kinase